MNFSLGDIFWVFLIFTMLQPLLKQRVIAAARARLIQKLEARRGSRVILLVHRQETLGFLGLPLFRYIDIDDAEKLLRVIRETDPQQPIDLVLHTPGGLVLASLQIARAIARRQGKVNVLVPHYAMSGGTLIALAADQIVMSEHAVLGPVDPQVGTYPAASLLRVVEKKPIGRIDDETLILADQAEMAQVQLRAAVKELIGDRLPSEQAEALAAALSEGRWTHDYGITPEMAEGFGLPVSTDIPAEVLELMALYPQPIRQRPTVEYLPRPRRSVPHPDSDPPA
jgi:ClpP class serine protease